jgi:hypothetical protein
MLLKHAAHPPSPFPPLPPPPSHPTPFRALSHHTTTANRQSKLSMPLHTLGRPQQFLKRQSIALSNLSACNGKWVSFQSRTAATYQWGSGRID